MVSISTKQSTTRRATATGRIYLSSTAFQMIQEDPAGTKFKKGDVLGTARIAGIMGGKKTSDLIPLCHPLGLTDLKVKFRLLEEDGEKGGGWVAVKAVAECQGKTGVEVRYIHDLQGNQGANNYLVVGLVIDGSLDCGINRPSDGLGHGKSGSWERDDY